MPPRLRAALRTGIAAGLMLAAAAPAAAQLGQSPSYKFLEAVRNARGEEVTAILDTPGQTIINTRDPSSGEGALHIVVRRGDMLYLRYLLGKGADMNLRDARGNTPLMLAVEAGQPAIVEQLLAVKANPNLANAGGETPLIRAVQRRDLNLVRMLLTGKANPDQTDSVAGMSARDYAKADRRTPAIAKLIDETPQASARAVAGPGL